MIWSLHAWNYETKSLGCWVMTTEEAEACLERRRQPGGDLHPDKIRAEQEKFFRELDKVNQRGAPNERNRPRIEDRTDITANCRIIRVTIDRRNESTLKRFSPIQEESEQATWQDARTQ